MHAVSPHLRKQPSDVHDAIHGVHAASRAQTQQGQYYGTRISVKSYMALVISCWPAHCSGAHTTQSSIKASRLLMLLRA